MATNKKQDIPPPQVPLRPASEIMRLHRMGSSYPTRLSFMRSLIRRLASENCRVQRTVWNINSRGYGHAVYSLDIGPHTYSLVAFSTELSPDQRTDRVIAEAWDTSYALFDGIPSTDDIARLERNAPRQEAGRFSDQELVLSRANKSVRFFDHVVDRLAQGDQPDLELVQSVGYLMRTTAVYGNGKFGIADRAKIAGRPELSGPFQAEMLTVWLIRGFTQDLVEHVAFERKPETAVKLAPEIRKHLGIGNSTGLGMAPFLVNHPTLLNNWVLVRETARARVLAVESTDAGTLQRMRELAERVARHLQQWNVPDARQMERIERLREEWPIIVDQLTKITDKTASPWSVLVQETEGLSVECQELVNSMVLEPHGELIDGLTDCMTSDTDPCLLPSETVSQVNEKLETAFRWAVDIDFSQRRQTAQFWYVSEEKLEPRLGSRYEEPGCELESPLDIARQIKQFHTDLSSANREATLAEFLMQYPQHRQIARRVQCCDSHPYSEIQDNLIADTCLPIDMLRFKLAFFGASKFDPKSDRWTRITLFQGAPLFDDILDNGADDWWLPVLGEAI